MAEFPRLLADIGGTYSRLLWQWDEQDSEPSAKVMNADYPDPIALLTGFIKARARPARIALALAAPVIGNSGIIHLTNRPDWAISPADLSRDLGGTRVEVLNDFTALALGIPFLDSRKRIQIGTGKPVSGAPMVVLGPGTGLGVSGLLPAADGWTPLSGEGGHMTLPALTEDEYALIHRYADENGHVSAEYLLSGKGLMRLYQYYSDENSEPAGQPEAVTRLAAQGDPAATRALDRFFALLGTVAGDIALVIGARGGVYLAGGILPCVREALQRSEFRNRFIAKGRYRSYLASVPTYLVSDPYLSLQGLAAWLDHRT